MSFGGTLWFCQVAINFLTMPASTELEMPRAVSSMYDDGYYLCGEGKPQGTFAFNSRTITRAHAIAEAGAVNEGDRIVDFGCGLGAMVAAFNTLGYDALGVEVSSYAATNPLPEAAGYVQALGSMGLYAYGEKAFDLAFAKDVLEHVPEDDIPGLSNDLLRIARKLLLVIPTAGADGKFIFDLYERDPSHVTRLTREGWMGLLSQSGASVRELPELTPKIRRPDKVAGTLCALLTRPE